MRTRVLTIIIALAVAMLLSGCANFDFDETGKNIVSAKEAIELIDGGAVLVDVQSSEDYGLSHIDGSINIPMSSLVTNEPYKNMLPEAGDIEKVMGEAGISESTEILVYDNEANMTAARVQWTLNMYSNFNVKVVSGGIKALKEAGAKTTMEAKILEPTTYTAGDKQKSLVVNIDYIRAQINMPDDGTVIVDTRSDEEYYAGTIPGATHINYIWNNYSNGEYKSARDIQLVYLDKGLKPENKIILFCKTSVRATQTYTALKNAGYKDVRIYDGAWLEYEDLENPQPPSENITPNNQDAS